MSTHCRGKCDTMNKTKDFHAQGRKYCSVCGYYMITINWTCFCCATRLRYTKKFASAKNKEAWREKTRM